MILGKIIMCIILPVPLHINTHSSQLTGHRKDLIWCWHHVCRLRSCSLLAYVGRPWLTMVTNNFCAKNAFQPGAAWVQIFALHRAACTMMHGMENFNHTPHWCGWVAGKRGKFLSQRWKQRTHSVCGFRGLRLEVQRASWIAGCGFRWATKWSWLVCVFVLLLLAATIFT